MRSTRTVFKIKCDCCNKEEVGYGYGQIQDKTKGWLLITISTATNVDDKERDICPACANVVTNTIRGGGPAFNRGVTIEER